MKYLLSVLLFFSTSIMAASIHYDNERSGEGLTVSETESGGIAWILFTHLDGGNYSASIPPTVSPPPPVIYPDLEDIVCEDEAPVWFTGHAEIFVDDVGIGPFYYNHAPEYPAAVDGVVADTYEVGTFHIEQLSDGYSLILESNGRMPDMYIFNVVHEFHEEIAK